MKYKTKEIIPNIYAVVVPDDYERAMLFCRVQEFYESPSKKFRDNKFSIWDYFRWYAEGKGCFSYPRDFVGFNLPMIVAKKCCDVNEIETPYDELMNRIVDDLFVNGTRQYLIGVDSLKDMTFDHEMAHALYYTDIDYKCKMDEITASVSSSDMVRFKRNLKQIGYCSAVVKDEIQAYMATEISKKAARGVVNKKKLHQRYKAVFKKYKF